MQITDVRVSKVNVEGKLKAYCSVVFDRVLAVHDLRVVEGVNGIFVAMPRRKTSQGQYTDVVHPVNTELRSRMQQAILDAYHALEQREVVSAEEAS